MLLCCGKRVKGFGNILKLNRESQWWHWTWQAIPGGLPFYVD